MTPIVEKYGTETFNLISIRGFRRVGFTLLDKVTQKVGVIRQRSRWEAWGAPLLSPCSQSRVHQEIVETLIFPVRSDHVADP